MMKNNLNKIDLLYPEHKHPHGVENTPENEYRIWVCTECGKILSSWNEPHSFQDCQSYKAGERDCTHCGTRLLKEWEFCPNCGKNKNNE